MKKLAIPLILLISIISACVLSRYISEYYLSLFYSLSMTIKSFIIFCLPVIIISSVYSSISNMHGSSLIILPAVIIFICCSNYIHVSSASFLARAFLDSSFDISSNLTTSNVELLWDFNFPKVISNNYALLLGFFLGAASCISSIKAYVDKLMKPIDGLSKIILKKIFIPVLPIFVFGMLLKALDQGIFMILYNNINIFGKMFMSLFAYLFILFMVSSLFNLRKSLRIGENIIEPVLTGFSSMSSAVALPFSLKAGENNTSNKSFSKFFISLTVNIHMIGDCVFIPFLAVIVTRIFGLTITNDQIYLFAFTFMITKFSGAGVPGGTILIMAPALEKIFFFSSEMVGLITSLYIIIDPIATSGSVFANNVFVIIFDKIITFFKKTSRE